MKEKFYIPPQGIESDGKLVTNTPTQQLFWSKDHSVVIRGSGVVGEPDFLREAARDYDAILEKYTDITGIPVVEHKHVIASSYSHDHSTTMPTLCTLSPNIGEHLTYDQAISGNNATEADAIKLDQAATAGLAYITYFMKNGGVAEFDLSRPDQCVLVRESGSLVMVDVGTIGYERETIPGGSAQGDYIDIQQVAIAGSLAYRRIIDALTLLQENMREFYERWPEVMGAENGSLTKLRQLEDALEHDAKLSIYAPYVDATEVTGY